MTVTKQKYEENRAICAMCPQYIRQTGQCGECLCFLKLKAKIKGQECPLEKWKN